MSGLLDRRVRRYGLKHHTSPSFRPTKTWVAVKNKSKTIDCAGGPELALLGGGLCTVACRRRVAVEEPDGTEHSVRVPQHGRVRMSVLLPGRVPLLQ